MPYTHLQSNASCCGQWDMYHLRYSDTPEHALMAVKKAFVGPESQTLGKFATLIVFSGVEKFLEAKPQCSERRYGETPAQYEQRKADWEKYEQREGYVSEFAKFIRKNKLGRIKSFRAQPNHINHPDHVIKVCMWEPDQAAIKAWQPSPELVADIAEKARILKERQAAERRAANW